LGSAESNSASVIVVLIEQGKCRDVRPAGCATAKVAKIRSKGREKSMSEAFWKSGSWGVQNVVKSCVFYSIIVVMRATR
jgi:hypothetical protein